MFKGILPKRTPSSDFTILTQLADVPQGKENMPNSSSPPIYPVGKPPKAGLTLGKKKKSTIESKKSKERDQNEQTSTGPDTEEAFDRLLDDLQIPPALRPKLLGMDAGVKAAMLKSSHLVAEKLGVATADTTPTTPTRNPASLRRVHSTESLGSPRPGFMVDAHAFEPPKSAGLPNHVSAQTAHPSPYGATSGRSRQASVDIGRFFSKSVINLGTASSADLTLGGKTSKDKHGSTKNLSPMRFCSLLQGQSSLQLDVEDIKKLRLMLRNESANWTEEFCKLGGYSALLTRLNEVLEVEWREEQHDDQVLHELLRCFKALSTSAIGCFALRSSCPTPYAQLVSLLYSDKKPGDVATRQLIVDLFLILFELYPPSALPAASKHASGRRREAWESRTSVATSNTIILPAPHKNLFSFIRSLLLTPAPPPAEAPGIPVSPHEFIESLHVPRVFKTYLQEMSDVCRDYFWVFCHPNNTIWVLSETDETRVEKPKAPSGMTGGVEYEAMCYFTTHLRFINAIASAAADLNLPKEHELSAYRFHHDLFLSGLERIVLISRKASTTYYPTLHLELSRYINHGLNAGYEFPYTVSRLIGLPPVALAKNPTQPLQPPPRHTSATAKRGSMGPPSTPPRRSALPGSSTGAATQGPSSDLSSYLNAPPPPALGLPTTWKTKGEINKWSD